jgi:DNA-binding MarR family transcriptional regulator
MAGFDPAFHQPVRLQIGAVLSTAQDAEFARLRDIAGVADSVMSKHLSALSEAGYVHLRKSAVDGRQRTWASMTGAGKRAFSAHVSALRQLAGG